MLFNLNPGGRLLSLRPLYVKGARASPQASAAVGMYTRARLNLGSTVAKFSSFFNVSAGRVTTVTNDQLSQDAQACDLCVPTEEDEARTEVLLDVQAVTTVAQGADVKVMLASPEQHYGWEALEVRGRGVCASSIIWCVFATTK